MRHLQKVFGKAAKISRLKSAAAPVDTLLNSIRDSLSKGESLLRINTKKTAGRKM